jgi:hypothetical protein
MGLHGLLQGWLYLSFTFTSECHKILVILVAEQQLASQQEPVELISYLSKLSKTKVHWSTLNGIAKRYSDLGPLKVKFKT